MPSDQLDEQLHSSFEHKLDCKVILFDVLLQVEQCKLERLHLSIVRQHYILSRAASCSVQRCNDSERLRHGRRDKSGSISITQNCWLT